MSVVSDSRVQAVIDDLQQTSRQQEAGIHEYFAARMQRGDLSWDGLDADAHQFFADKLVALDTDKAEFCYLLCRATAARRVVEVGTSHGLSTLYLADAVRANGGGEVIATEHEPAKAEAARASFAQAGLSDWIDLREGDLRHTLADLTGPVDLVLMDIWTEMVCPAMERIAPHLRPGAVIVCDNTAQFAEAYRDYFRLIAAGPYVTRTLPFSGGLELTLRL